MSLRITLLPFLFALSLQGSPAQPGARRATSGVEVEALAKLDLWIGEWSGSGWSQIPGGPRVEFELTERVQRRVADSVLLIEGHGTTSGAQGERVVTHDGLVLVYFDKRTRRYHWNGHDLGRDPIDVEPRVRDRGLEWSLVDADGKPTVRFTIEFDQQEWREVGELSPDGESWTRFMALTLKRKA
jgi:hypothetical protein